ncbi:hypothetical protein EVAR_48425_1 [Eumeta japonica]|uniref:Uncharacterized protein n=1 Tax=Eumeta variegata TaxID=151549 RepID=A0A4C1XRV7_EUMVA|nr:hypothetical protein EVAR_48425_1 [Eumeta japonica]
MCTPTAHPAQPVIQSSQAACGAVVNRGPAAHPPVRARRLSMGLYNYDIPVPKNVSIASNTKGPGLISGNATLFMAGCPDVGDYFRHVKACNPPLTLQSVLTPPIPMNVNMNMNPYELNIRCIGIKRKNRFESQRHAERCIGNLTSCSDVVHYAAVACRRSTPARAPAASPPAGGGAPSRNLYRIKQFSKP